MNFGIYYSPHFPEKLYYPIMQALFVTDTRLNENYTPLRVRVKNKPEPKRVKKAKAKNNYPQIVMPEQPVGYIKPKRHECW